MELRAIDAAGVVLHLAPGDCAKLAELCELGADKYITPEDAPRAEAALIYATALRALAVAGIVPNAVVPREWQSIADGLAGLGLAGLLRLPGRQAQEGTE